MFEATDHTDHFDDRSVVDVASSLTGSGRVAWADPPAPPGSTVACVRMAAGGGWDRIVSSIQAAEDGRVAPDEIIVQPGGQLVPVHRGRAGPSLSKLPEERMASEGPWPDRREIAAFDPTGMERWRFVDDPSLAGWVFTLTPVAQPFTFFCFRYASLGGGWVVSPLDPNLDALLGHEHHVISVALGGGEHVPIVCKSNRGQSHRDLSEVRGTAAKFALYHSLHRHGLVPFSA